MATSPQRKKDRTLEALLRQLEGLAHQHPVVMVVEDAHWIDPTSLELLDLTVERVGSLRVLLIRGIDQECLRERSAARRKGSLCT